MHINNNKNFKRKRPEEIMFNLPTNMQHLIFQSTIYPVNSWNRVCYLFIPLLKIFFYFIFFKLSNSIGVFYM